MLGGITGQQGDQCSQSRVSTQFDLLLFAYRLALDVGPRVGGLLSSGKCGRAAGKRMWVQKDRSWRTVMKVDMKLAKDKYSHVC